MFRSHLLRYKYIIRFSTHNAMLSQKQPQKSFEYKSFSMFNCNFSKIRSNAIPIPHNNTICLQFWNRMSRCKAKGEHLSQKLVCLEEGGSSRTISETVQLLIWQRMLQHDIQIFSWPANIQKVTVTSELFYKINISIKYKFKNKKSNINAKFDSVILRKNNISQGT